MYCTKCGLELKENDNFCSQCGATTPNARDKNLRASEPRLERSIYDKKIAGVCGGIAQYLNIDSTLVRLIWVTLIFVPPSIGLIAYIVAWIVMPKEPPRLPAGTAEATRVYQS